MYVFNFSRCFNKVTNSLQRFSSMDVEEFRRVGKEMIDFIADHKEGIDSLPVVPDVKPGR